jgi:hypothetical protein
MEQALAKKFAYRIAAGLIDSDQMADILHNQEELPIDSIEDEAIVIEALMQVREELLERSDLDDDGGSVVVAELANADMFRDAN